MIRPLCCYDASGRCRISGVRLWLFFQERLVLERQASVNTCDSYAYAFKLLLNYASKRLKVSPSRLALEQIDARLVTGFLNDLEASRANAASTRNVSGHFKPLLSSQCQV